jgi:hypothetical protein
MRTIRSNDGEMCEAEVSHGTRDRADIERVTGRNENNVDAVALGLGEQEKNVEVCGM